MAIAATIKHASSPATLAQLLQPSLAAYFIASFKFYCSFLLHVATFVMFCVSCFKF